MSQADNTSCTDDIDPDVLEELEALRRENAELKEALRTDMLTGLFNYRHLLEALESEMERTRRTRMPTALVMIDIDHFKQVNDTWGHEIGNQALKLVADTLRKTLRKMDIPCRFGGEEFAVILPGTPLPQAVLVAERLRHSLAENVLETGGEPIQITASFGVEIYRMDMKLSVDEFIHLTDGYLYQAKQNGRNCVAHPQLPPSTEVSVDEKSALLTPSDNKPE